MGAVGKVSHRSRITVFTHRSIKDRSFKQSVDSTRFAVFEANEDELDWEAISYVENDNKFELKTTRDNKTELRLPTAGMSEQGLKEMHPLAMVKFCVIVS